MSKTLDESGEMQGEDVNSQNSEPVQLEGNVESFTGHTLFGWVRNTSNPQERINVQAYVKNNLIGSGCADIYRKDLSEAGIGDGRHGFQIELDDSIMDNNEHTVVIIDENTRDTLGSLPVCGTHYAVSRIDSIESANINGYLTLQIPSDITGFDIELCVDGIAVTQSICSLSDENNHYQFSIEVPSEFYDDCFHLFSVRLVGYPTDAEPLLEKLHSVITPWKHLAHDIQTANLSSLSKIAGLRYKSLQSGIRRLSTDEHSPDALQHLMQAHDIVVQGYEGRRDFPVLTLPGYSTPQISIVIPVHNNFELTYHCIASLILNASNIQFEVIIVDDQSTDKTVDIDNYIKNLNVVRNKNNLRFLLSAEAGANTAKGDYILFLNNDTEVSNNWLDALIYTFETFADVGMVGSKLIYPTGKLQEAGGIVWGNGHPWNVGNRKNASDPIYNYTRQADYLSGAAMMLKRSVWKEIGGFSKDFIPAYYEDTDLAFKVREAGYKTLYCPASTVVHFEGMSNGTELNAGVKRFQSINAPRFRRKWRHRFKHNEVEGKNLESELDRDADFRVLVVDHSTPKPDFDAGGYAVTQEIMLMQELGCKVTFAPNNLAHMGSYTQSLQDRGVECIYAPFCTSVGEHLRDKGQIYDLVYIIRYDVAEQIIPYVREYSNAKIVLNNCDLHFLRELRAALVSKDQSLDGALQTRDRELSVMRMVDAVLSYNDVEHSVIASHNLSEENIFKCPWVLHSKRSTVPFEKRQGIAFLGGFNHTPNIEALEYLVSEVMPDLIKSAPHIKLYVYGSNMPDDIEELASDHVIIKGYVKSLSSVFDQCRVFVAPLLSGAGIKGKVLESIAFGVPSVLSPVAAESTGLTHGSSTYIARTNEDWVKHITSLYEDETLWKSISDSTQSVIENDYDFENGISKMTDLFEYLELDPALNRQPLFQQNKLPDFTDIVAELPGKAKAS